MNAMVYPSKERLLELFEYRDGSLFNKTTRSGRSLKGDMVGFPDVAGYWRVRIEGKTYQLHRIIWIMHNGDIEKGLVVDHKNGIKDDNRIDNLRPLTRQENSFNNSKAKGYHWSKKDRRWIARICTAGKIKHLGTFKLKEDAAEAYQVAKEKYHIIEER
jgi:hypothetical protein